MRIWNLTPHAMHYDDGQVRRLIPSDGVVRLMQIDEPAETIDGLATCHTRYEAIEGLPDELTAGDVIIVSTLVGDLWPLETRPAGITILVPDTGATCRRDEHGRIVSVSRFIRKPSVAAVNH